MTTKTTKATPRKAPAKKTRVRKAPAKKPVDAITVSVSDFEKAIARVKPFACTDETLPMINGIMLELKDRVLTVVATDRFTIGASLVHPLFYDEDEELPADFQVVIRLPELPIVAAVLKRCVLGRIDLQVLGGQIVIDGIRVGDTDLNGQFPDWRRLVTEAEKRINGGVPEIGEIAMNPAYLRRFAQIRPLPTMRVTGANHPALAVAEGFIGLLMPVRITTTREEVLAKFGIAMEKPESAESAA
ncbi:hypothetical protein [uncultured Gordonia sp.]|uniref:hypothetical protein n=1 Tax=uncultured Gordonia sp. TaxID=198437 RepID=UPI00258E9C23|nr:hypothetical protein [uncultured Gordonia sp.]